MRSRSVLFLFLIAAALAAYIWFGELGGTLESEPDYGKRSAFKLAEQKVQGFSITRDGQTVHCVNTGGKWVLDAPVQGPAETALVQRFFKAMHQLREGVLIETDSPEAYGFTTPQATVEIELPDGKRQLSFGKNRPMQGGIYVRDNASGIVVGSNSTLDAFAPADANMWRRRQLFDESFDNLCQIEVQRPDGYLRLKRLPGQNFIIEQPVQAQIKPIVLERWLDTLALLRAQSFVTDQVGAPQSYGFGEDGKKLILTDCDGTSRTLLLGVPRETQPGETYAKWLQEDSVFTLPTAAANLFELNARKLRDAGLVYLPQENINSLRIQGNGNDIILQHNDLGWHYQSGTDPVDQATVKTMINDWSKATIAHYVKDQSTVKPAQSIHVSFSTAPEYSEHGSDAVDTVHFEVVGASNNVVRLRQNGQEDYLIAAPIMRAVSTNPLYYRSRTVLKIAQDEILSIALASGDNTQLIVRADSSESFGLPPNGEGALRENALSKTLSLAQGLEALNYIGLSSDELTQFGLDEPQKTITFGLTGENGLSRVILLGNRLANGDCYSMIRGRDEVFLLPNIVANILADDLLILPEKSFAPTNSVPEVTGLEATSVLIPAQPAEVEEIPVPGPATPVTETKVPLL